MASPTDCPSLLGVSVLPALRSLALRHFTQRCFTQRLLRSVDLHNPRCPMTNPVEFGRELGTDKLVESQTCEVSWRMQWVLALCLTTSQVSGSIVSSHRRGKCLIQIARQWVLELPGDRHRPF